MSLPLFYIDDIVKRAILEDINYIDSTTDYLIKENSRSDCEFVAKACGVVAGIEIAMRVFEMLDDTVCFTYHKKDGDAVKKGEIIAEVHGSTRAMLKGERTALNLLQHLSGIATKTRICVDLVCGTNASVTDTRKTIPGIRGLQKYAVVCGGGKNHRFNLSDACMLKDNHIDSYGSLTNAVLALREKIGHTVKIEVEVRNFTELDEAIDVGADIIMLDNMSIEDMSKAVAITNKRAILEASGNITEQNIADVAKTGVDIISLGALTHSVNVLDISMKIVKS